MLDNLGCGFDDLMGFKAFLDFTLFTGFPDFQVLFEFLQFVTVFFELSGYMFMNHVYDLVFHDFRQRFAIFYELQKVLEVAGM